MLSLVEMISIIEMICSIIVALCTIFSLFIQIMKNILKK